MALVKPCRPSGFGEYLPAEQIAFNRLMDIIREIYERYGFAPLDTPDLELSQVLLAKGGGETDKQVYELERDGKRLCLRFDLTVPLARYVAEHEHELAFPFRRYHIGKVHRAERAQAGRFREFYQCDIDVIGSRSPIVDAEFPAIINEIFTCFNFGEFTIRLNDRRILNGFFESIGLMVPASVVLRIIDKIEKVSRDDIVAELFKAGVDRLQVDRILQFTQIRGDNDSVIASLRAIQNPSKLLEEGIDKLEALIAALWAMGVPEHRFAIDLKIARGLDYYTGTVYETILNDYPSVGSVCSGGRYDNLAGFYTDTPLPGVGISIGLSRLFYALRQVDAIKLGPQSPAQIIVIPQSEEQMQAALAIAAKLRNAGMPVMSYNELNGWSKALKYANRMGFRCAVMVGEQEIKNNAVQIKDMITGESTKIAMDEVVTYLTQAAAQ